MAGMACPECGGRLDVYESRPADAGNTIWRRRECRACHRRYTTFEQAVSDDDDKVILRRRERGRGDNNRKERGDDRAA